MKDLAYAWEKFSNAVSCLTSSKPLQARLRSAYLSFHTITLDDFEDAGMRARYSQVLDRLTTVRSDPDKGYVPATLEQMSDQEAEEVADLIVGLCFSIARQRWERNAR